MNRITLINQIISKFHYTSYLEIGCRNNECFDNIKALKKTGVDPERGGTFRGTSDEYFQYNKRFWRQKKFDIIFIDGLHWSEQVKKDIINSLEILNENGTIVIHDANPLTEDEASWPYKGTYYWNGDVWKAVVEFRQSQNLDIAVGEFDHGCAVIRVRSNSSPFDLLSKDKETSWNHFDKNRKELLNLMPFEQLIRWL